MSKLSRALLLGSFVALQGCEQEDDSKAGITVTGISRDGTRTKALALISGGVVKCSVNFPDLPVTHEIKDDDQRFQQIDRDNPLWKEGDRASVWSSPDRKYTIILNQSGERVARIINNEGNGIDWLKITGEDRLFLAKCRQLKELKNLGKIEEK